MATRPISNGGAAVFTAELRSLDAERDPELQAQGLFHLARRAEARHQYDAAAQIYHRLAGTPLAERAAVRLQVLTGEGPVGDRAEFLLSNLSHEAFNPSMLFAMGSAGALFKATRLLTLSRLASAPAAAFTRGLAARGLASSAGFAVEALTFPAAGRLANFALGHDQDWSARALSREVVSSALVLGGMKLGGWASSSLAGATLGRSSLSPLTRGLFQQTGMFSGILLGQRLEEMAGLRRAVSTSSTLVDGLALLLNFNIAGRVTQAAMGEGFRRWEQSVEMQTQTLSRPWPSNFQGGMRNPFGVQAPAFATAGTGEVSPLGPRILMMQGESRGSAKPLSSMLEISLYQMRNPNPQVWQSHLAHLESVLLDAQLPARDYVTLYQRLQAELTEDNNAVNRQIANTLSELLSRIPLTQPGPQRLFNRMIHIKRFPDHSLGDTLAAWARNPGLESKHRRQILHLAEKIFKDQPRDYGEEALALLTSSWHRFSGEGLVFRRAVEAAMGFVHDRIAWFDPGLDGLSLARLVLLDPGTPSQNRDLLLNQLQRFLYDENLFTPHRVKVMEFLEELAGRNDLTEVQRGLFRRVLPVWRNEQLYFNARLAVASPITHCSELAYLIAQDYVPTAQKRRFAQALREAFFVAPPNSQTYQMMIGDAIRYIGEPQLTPEMRQTFTMQILKALNNSETKVQPIIQNFLVEKVTSIPKEERVGLVNRLIEELVRHDARSKETALLLSTLTELVNPTDALLHRFHQIAESSPDPEARETAEIILQRWQSIN